MIPRLFHFIWLGSKLPKLTENYMMTFNKRNPEWKINLISNAYINILLNELQYKHLLKLYENSNLYCQKADIARLAILHKFGGFYIDADVECLKSFNDLRDNKFVIAKQDYEPPDNREMYCNAIMGSVPNGKFITNCINEVENYITKDRTSAGPKFISKMIKKNPNEVTLLDRQVFYPFMWWERQNYNPYNEAYTNHHWWGN